MKCTFVKPARLEGEITAPPSKSVLHRAVICAALAKGESIITNIIHSDDIKATVNVVNALGLKARFDGETIRAGGQSEHSRNAHANCYESGSTLRFLLPLAGALGHSIVFTGHGRLPKRPMSEYLHLLGEHGMEFEMPQGEYLPLKVSGRLKSGMYRISGDISSQYITGLLFALPMLDGDSVIEITTPLESKGYVDITIDILKHFGIDIRVHGSRYLISGNQSYVAKDFYAEGDYSSAAFFLCAGALGTDVRISGLNLNSAQGDKEIIEILKRFGANITVSNSLIRVFGGNLHAAVIDAPQIPDLVPILAVVASVAQGTTEIKNAGRLRLKESDRLSAISNNLKGIGAEVIKYEDSLVINGKQKLKGGNADSYNDHRIAMAMSIAALNTEDGIYINGSESINKSYPHFYDDLRKLGGKVDEL